MPKAVVFMNSLSAESYLSIAADNGLARGQIRDKRMVDLSFITAAVGFFVLAIGYTHACEKLRRGSRD
jgi:hypothetical protein